MSGQVRVQLFSDTKTRPSAPMLAAMAGAETGDEQAGEDPTTNVLCERTAAMLGKAAALFLPSGTMCNQIALAVHCRPGDEVIAERSSHIINFEVGGAAAIAGAMINAIDGARGIFEADQVLAAIRPPMRHAPKATLVAVEQTANMGGGSVWPLTRLAEVAEAGRGAGMAVHMDGARLLNAVVASNVSAKDYAETADSVWIDLSKGLGCPVGAVMAGSAEFIDAAWRWKQRLGGAMRQSGVLAAAGLYALDYNVERLAEDHANARHLAEALAQIPGIEIDMDSVETNILFLDISASGMPAPDISARLAEQGIAMGAVGPGRMRAVTHLDVDRAGIEEAAAALREIVSR
ncbi:MAG: GntG family PLP-dependent aldolase [Rhodospirillales bacterium]|jgi:threonine aldolase|nr:low specificity L-threonine aldolase [Rhodospirillaceae bacterium]MDP6428135.1 GntG family PLP-dependent aldolase [Rhodospirillales bacterium]MDP6645165.1 GntG family PLP-dependent aldolase [Rhodospirillales bacterium]MDP6841266.1 GntG family PLP-dependent aldolase [Rhodospirillales bacterium]